jgi:hypothetical protein
MLSQSDKKVRNKIQKVRTPNIPRGKQTRPAIKHSADMVLWASSANGNFEKTVPTKNP